MDQTEYHSKQTLTQLINIQFLKKITQLLVSVSVFSYFFSYPSLFSFLQSFNLYFSTFPSHLFSHTIDKNCIFLLCNGLLVFLAKYSGLTSSLSGSNHNEESFKSVGDGLQPEPLIILETKEAMLDKEALVETIGSAEIVAAEQHGREMDHFIKEVEKETEKSISKEEEQEHEEQEREEEEEGNGMLSTEELNKKFDDFIRRMKEEIRIEAQQQLVMVQ
ncbi:hypothetical protein FH972_020208 [Carpinus fangiana]|uniref:DUF4408 domain-containing protein n=1 Tax=Carpinus fangiana TaxID=176857 RepID=A0A5N6RSH2_9ROSI|nr:hypothetical protein FH972_020208 [Carpinus fangiana]